MNERKFYKGDLVEERLRHEARLIDPKYRATALLLREAADEIGFLRQDRQYWYDRYAEADRSLISPLANQAVDRGIVRDCTFPHCNCEVHCDSDAKAQGKGE